MVWGAFNQLSYASVPCLRSRKASARDRDLICVFCVKQRRKQFSPLPSTNGFSILLIKSILPSLQPTKVSIISLAFLQLKVDEKLVAQGKTAEGFPKWLESKYGSRSSLCSPECDYILYLRMTLLRRCCFIFDGYRVDKLRLIK
ncbi:Uncharacterized protein Rs2_10203 [Raphanus sativus]|nr:Uncharacterized protein Rs2_10203 [Raphanus sativus]